MKAPYLQIALDNESLEDAFHTLRGGLGNEVDIIEVGTMLILMEGVRAARIMRACFPDKIMVADAALSVAHFGPKVLAAGTQFVTMFSPARNEVKAAILAQAKAGGQDVQIERKLDLRRPAGVEGHRHPPDHLWPAQLGQRPLDRPGRGLRAPAVRHGVRGHRHRRHHL